MFTYPSRGTVVLNRVGRGKAGDVKVSIPRELHNAILKLQLESGGDFDEAALKAAALIEPNGSLFKDTVLFEYYRYGKAEFMKQLNASRETIRKRGYAEGAEAVRRSEDNFHPPCCKCGQPMSMSSRDSNWEQEKTTLYAAFRTWSHVNCERQTPP